MGTAEYQGKQRVKVKEKFHSMLIYEVSPFMNMMGNEFSLLAIQEEKHGRESSYSVYCINEDGDPVHRLTQATIRSEDPEKTYGYLLETVGYSIS